MALEPDIEVIGFSSEAPAIPKVPDVGIIAFSAEVETFPLVPDIEVVSFQEIDLEPVLSFGVPFSYTVLGSEAEPVFSEPAGVDYYVTDLVQLELVTVESEGQTNLSSMSVEIEGNHNMTYMTQEIIPVKVPALRAFSIVPVDEDLPWLNDGPVLHAFSLEHFELQKVYITPDLGWPNAEDMLNPAKNPELISAILAYSDSVDLTAPDNYDANVKSLANMIFYVEDIDDSISKYFTLTADINGQFSADRHEHLWIDNQKPDIIHRFMLVLHPAGDTL